MGEAPCIFEVYVHNYQLGLLQVLKVRKYLFRPIEAIRRAENFNVRQTWSDFGSLRGAKRRVCWYKHTSEFDNYIKYVTVQY